MSTEDMEIERRTALVYKIWQQTNDTVVDKILDRSVLRPKGGVCACSAVNITFYLEYIDAAHRLLREEANQ